MSSNPVTDESDSDIPRFWRDIGRDFLLPVFLLVALDLLVAIPLVRGGHIPLIAGIILVLLPKFILLPWAGAQLLDFTERHHRRHAMSGVKISLLGVLLVAVLALLVCAIESIQAMVFSSQQRERITVTPDPKYRFGYHRANRTYSIEGEIDFGITRDFRAFIAGHPGGNRLVLDSPGGSIYEGRGLRRIAIDHDLATHVDTTCSSACVIAFLGGATRSLGAEARLGFHQYAVDYSNLRHEIPFYDPASEQAHDVELMRESGVSEAFLERAFHAPHSGIWYPTRAELADAGVTTP